MWGKKEAQRADDEDPTECGDHWDHVALDVQSRLVVSLVPGRRTEDKTYALVQDFARRANEGRPPELMTSDEYKPYRAALLKTYGVWVVPPRTGQPGRPRQPYPVPPGSLVYAVMHKTRRKGRVVVDGIPLDKAANINVVRAEAVYGYLPILYQLTGTRCSL